MAGKDPLEKIAELVRSTVAEALAERDGKEKEAKDPWARIEGIIDRAVAKQFGEFRKGLLDDDGAGGGEGGKGDDEEGGNFITELFGGGRGR